MLLSAGMTCPPYLLIALSSLDFHGTEFASHEITFVGGWTYQLTAAQ
jgi:hypothetical protein